MLINRTGNKSCRSEKLAKLRGRNPSGRHSFKNLPSHRQRGSALILAMLVAAWVAIMAVNMAEDFRVDSRLAEGRSLQAKIKGYLHGTESLASGVLWADYLRDSSAEGSQVDHLAEDWALAGTTLPTDIGFVRVQLTDAQGKFNINSLQRLNDNYYDSALSVTDRLTAEQKLFIRLLKLVQPEMNDNQGLQMVEAIVDWLDEDDRVSGQGGAESLYYLSQPVSRRPANRAIGDISELLMVRHMTPEVLAALRPYLAALPSVTPININTAVPMVLQAINSDDTLQPASASHRLTLLKAREEAPYTSVVEALNRAGFQGVTATAAALSVNSHYFAAQVNIQADQQQRHANLLFYRNDNGVSVIRKDHSQLCCRTTEVVRNPS